MDIEMIASLGLSSAEQLADRALAAASEAGVKICVTVVDRAGYPLVFKRHPGAPCGPGAACMAGAGAAGSAWVLAMVRVGDASTARAAIRRLFMLKAPRPDDWLR